MYRLRNLLGFFSLLLIMTSTSVFAQQAINLEDGLAIQGYDPVSYFSGSPVPGKSSITASYNNAIYNFSSERNKALFLESPDQYLPQYGGWCAYAMLEGDSVDINPESFKIIDGKLYLFYDGFWGDTLKRWNKLTDKQPETELVTTANKHWNELD